MYYKIVNKFDVSCLEESISGNRLMIELPIEIRRIVTGAIRDRIEIYDEYYGESRHPESDLGGFLIFLPELEDTELFYDKILKYYSLDVAYAEIDEEIAVSGNIKFRQQTFLLSSDYGLVIIYREH